MKKIIVSILVIGMLLSTVPLSMGVNEPVNEEESIETSSSGYLESTTLIQNDEPPRFFEEPEYVPGEIIIKFKDEVTVNMEMSSVQTMVTGETSREPLEETTTAGATSSEEMTNAGEASTMSTGEIVTFGIETIDVFNIEFDVISAEKLVEDDSIPSLSNTYKLTFDENVNLGVALEQYGNDSSVEFAEPNYIYQHCGIPNDPYFNQQWALHNTGQNGGTPDADIDAPEAWDTEMGDNSVVIAIIDSGVDYTNPDLGNCTESIIELDYIIESQHPMSDDYREDFNFAEIFSDYDFDSISLHFSKIDLEGSSDIEVKAGSKHGSKYLLDLRDNDFKHGLNVSDVWTRYSEMGYNDGVKIDADIAFWGSAWGFAIDKVRLLKYEDLSQMSNKYADGYDFVYDDPDHMDDFGHGTHCAGIAAAVTDNNAGMAGVAGNCKIMPIRVFGEDDNANLFGLLRSIIYAANNGADVISMSFAGFKNIFLELVTKYAYNIGVVLVASAGNDGEPTGLLGYPAVYDHVISVASTDRNDTRSEYSNYGSWLDLAAPGEDIVSLRAQGTDMYQGSWYYYGASFVPPFDYSAILCKASGTSMSCPLVAGVAALILSQDPSLTPQQVRTILRSSTEPSNTDEYIGTGMINADLAVQKTAPVVAELDDNEKYIEGNFKIKGTVKGKLNSKFQGYVLEYGFGVYPDTWIEIAHSNNQPISSLLYTWDTTDMEEGAYTIQLRVTYDGIDYIDRAFFFIDNIANDYYVDDDFTSSTPGWGSDHFNKIQHGIDVCGEKDTIRVSSGTYYEKLSITSKSVKLVGENKHTTIIDGNYPILILLGKIDISGFTIKSGKPSSGSEYYSSIEGLFSSSNTISDNIFTESSGIAFFHTSENMISKNTFDNCDIVLGVWLQVATHFANNKVSENSIINGYIAIFYLHRNEVFDNTFSGNKGGISVECSNFNKIFDNHIKNCYGLTIGGDSVGNRIYQNNITDGKYGVVFWPGPYMVVSSNYIYENNIINNSMGICLDGDEWSYEKWSQTEDNVISKNNISNNQYGIYSSDYSICEDNKFYLNNLIDNDENVYDEREDSARHIWYAPLTRVGNYWSDYTEKYPDAEKIIRILLPDYWDIPYDVSGEDLNQDLYPLVEQYGSSQSNPQSNPSSQTQEQSTPSGTEGSSSPTNN